jgi:acetyl/propionyl-CoA carboxylase alpha subunit
VRAASITGHAIEARLYAEDPSADHRPASGVVHRFRVPDLPGIRVDAGVRGGTVVGTHYDPLLAKVIAHAPDRAQAVQRLARALDEAHLHGPVTNRDLLVGILREPDFAAGRTDTGYLTRHDPAVLTRRTDSAGRAVQAVAAAIADQADRRARAAVLAPAPSGWRNVRSQAQHAQYRDGERR